MRFSDERGGFLAGIVTGWVLRLFLGLAILGIAGFEAGAILVVRLSVDQIATEAAEEAGFDYGRRRSASKALEVAEAIVERGGGEIIEFDVQRELDRVVVRVRKRASTFVTHHIGPFERFTVAEATSAGRIR